MKISSGDLLTTWPAFYPFFLIFVYFGIITIYPRLIYIYFGCKDVSPALIFYVSLLAITILESLKL